MQRLHEYSELFRKTGPWCTIYTDASTGTVDTLRAGELRPDQIGETLKNAGASRADVEAAKGIDWQVDGAKSPVCRYVVIRDGRVELDEVLPGTPVGLQQSSVGVIPDLLPLVKHRGQEIPYVVAEVDRAGGEIRLHHADKRIEDTSDVAGSTENLKKVPTGGWSQGQYQHRTQEIWRRNADEVAGAIDRVAAASRARLLIVSGDIRARDLVVNQLSDGSRAIASVVDSHTRTAGADPAMMKKAVEQRVAEIIAHRQHDLLERLAVQQGRPNPLSATGVGEVVHALQQAQVETLLLNDGALLDRSLLALDAEPWLATDAGEALEAGVLGKTSAPAAILRAVAMTDAEVVLVPSGALPGGVEAAALLRWPTGPAVPAG